MNNSFQLDPTLAGDAAGSIELNLCKVLLFNNSLFPWVILVPKKNNLKEIIDLSEQDQIILMEEIAKVSKIMQKMFSPDKLNIASLGNIVEQLHIHVIVRFKNDPAWPKPAFGHEKQAYSIKQAQKIIKQFQGLLNDHK